MSIHPACVLICEEGHVIRQITVAYRRYRDAIHVTDHSAYLEDLSLRKAVPHGQCPCGNPLLPYMLPEGAHASLIHVLHVMEYPIQVIA